MSTDPFLVRPFDAPADAGGVFGVRRAVRMAAQRRGLPFQQAERVALEALNKTGSRTSAILAGIDALSGDDEREAQ